MRCLAVIGLCAVCTGAFAQAKKPTIMVMPSEEWCKSNNYMTEYAAQGKTELVPDYKAALQDNFELAGVISKIGELMAERGFPLKDLSSVIRSLHQENMEDEMLQSSTSGAELAETPYENLLKRAKADIIIEVTWEILTTGPKKSVSYIVRGLDSYTNIQVAAASGTGAPSISAEIPVLLEEAVIEKMDNFTGQLQAHFDDLLTNGREVTVGIKVFDNGSGTNLESEFDGEMLTDIIDNWMYENTEGHRYNVSDATENMMLMEQVRIPVYNAKGRPLDTRNFVNELRKFLRKPPYNVECKLITKGLGRADLIIGEK